MFKIVFGAIKLAIFATVILVLGNWVQWKGRTISDHVATSLSQAQRAKLPDLDSAADRVAERAKEMTSHLSLGNLGGQTSPQSKTAPRSKEREAEEIPESARSKLRDLIQELNGSRPGND